VYNAPEGDMLMLNSRKVAYFSKENPLSPLGKRIVENAQAAGRAAILKHKAMGNPIYYTEGGMLVEEQADGIKYAVKVSKTGVRRLHKL